MPYCNTYRLTWVSLTLGVGYLYGCSSKAQPLLLTLDEGYLLIAALPDPQRGIAPLGPPANLVLKLHTNPQEVWLFSSSVFPHKSFVVILDF